MICLLRIRCRTLWITLIDRIITEGSRATGWSSRLSSHLSMTCQPKYKSNQVEAGSHLNTTKRLLNSTGLASSLKVSHRGHPSRSSFPSESLSKHRCHLTLKCCSTLPTPGQTLLSRSTHRSALTHNSSIYGPPDRARKEQGVSFRRPVKTRAALRPLPM